MDVLILLLAMAIAQFEPDGPGLSARDVFLADNLTETLYHEVGHAVIDQQKLPIYGREEDAADVFAAVMIERMNGDEAATRIFRATAKTYRANARDLEKRGEEPDFADVHSTDKQRQFNIVCLAYGAAPNLRENLAMDFNLPETRLETCPGEYEMAVASWGDVLDSISPEGDQNSFVLEAVDEQSFASNVLRRELVRLNREISLQSQVVVRLEPCDEANAFYDTEVGDILICMEFIDSIAWNRGN